MPAKDWKEFIPTEMTPVEHDGVTHTLVEWSVIRSIPYPTLRARFNKGLRGDALFPRYRTGEYKRY